MNVYAAYQFNLLNDTHYVKSTGTDKDDKFHWVSFTSSNRTFPSRPAASGLFCGKSTGLPQNKACNDKIYWSNEKNICDESR
jgi:hypothetical protein